MYRKSLRKFVYKIFKKARFYKIYVQAHIILLFNYNKDKFISGKWFQKERYGKFAAPGWEWIVNDYLTCRKNRVNKDVPWPCSSRIVVANPENIEFHPDDLNNFQTFGCYFQAIGRILIGKGTYIAPNVGIITANHSFSNLDEHDSPKDVCIGTKCWIGMNSIILPGVTLGNNTIVGAGAVVTRSFTEGNCVVAGNPAKIIKKL